MDSPVVIDLTSILALVTLELRPNGISQPFPLKKSARSRDLTFLNTEVARPSLPFPRTKSALSRDLTFLLSEAHRPSLPCPREKTALSRDPTHLLLEAVSPSLPFPQEKAALLSRDPMFLVTEGVVNLIDQPEHHSVET